MDSVITILSTSLDLYLIYHMTSFLDGRIRYRVAGKNLFLGIWTVSSAILLYFLRGNQFYGAVYCASLILLICLKRKKGTIRSLLYLAGSMLIVGMTNLIITCGLSFVFSEGMYVFNMPIIESIAGIICFFLYFLLLNVARYRMPGIETRLSYSLLGFSVLMLASNTHILLYAMHFTERIVDITEKREISMVFSMVSLGMLIELALVILSVAGVYFYREMVKYKDKFIEAQTTCTEMVQIKNKELRAIKHDCKAHYVVLEYLLKKERYEEAMEYAKTLTDSLKGVGEFCNTGSFVMDALLSEKIMLAREKGVDFLFDVRVPEQWKVAETDQCILFSNLLNNAFEAVDKLENSLRKVEISTRIFGEELLVRVANTYNGELYYKDGEFITSKEEKDEHGFGLQNIDKIVEKYKGSLDVKEEDGMFVVMVRA